MDRFNFSGIWISLQLWSDRQNFEGFPVYFLWAECLLLTAAPSLCQLSGALILPFQQWSLVRPINSEHSNGKQSLMNMSVISLNQGCIPLVQTQRSSCPSGKTRQMRAEAPSSRSLHFSVKLSVCHWPIRGMEVADLSMLCKWNSFNMSRLYNQSFVLAQFQRELNCGLSGCQL